jgi:hypothetical protein
MFNPIDTYRAVCASLGLDPVWVAGFALILTLSVARYRFGPITSVRWQPLRRLLVPVIHRIGQRRFGEEWYALTEQPAKSHVATLRWPLQTVLADLEAEDYGPQPLSSLGEDWEGNPEVASWAKYVGPKPFPGAPEWLRRYQVHVRLYRTDDGRIRVAAHKEINPWRPDLWRAHYRGRGQDIQAGREQVADDLGVALEDVEE